MCATWRNEFLYEPFTRKACWAVILKSRHSNTCVVYACSCCTCTVHRAFSSNFTLNSTIKEPILSYELNFEHQHHHLCGTRICYNIQCMDQCRIRSVIIKARDNGHPQAVFFCNDSWLQRRNKHSVTSKIWKEIQRGEIRSGANTNLSRPNIYEEVENIQAWQIMVRNNDKMYAKCNQRTTKTS